MRTKMPMTTVDPGIGTVSSALPGRTLLICKYDGTFCKISTKSNLLSLSGPVSCANDPVVL
jgi:hypothetical protein